MPALALLVLGLGLALGTGGGAEAQQRRYAWADIDCGQSRLAAWSGLRCRATNVVTNEGNVGAFRQWAAVGSGRGGYYAHLFLWEAQNGFSYLSADEPTAEFARWMFEHGKDVTGVSPVARYKQADYVTFRDPPRNRTCTGFRRLGPPQRGGYGFVIGGILCAPPGSALPESDVRLFIDSVALK